MSIKPEKLLAHTDFVRYLARTLILDENLADDVAQDALVAAIERPPQTAEALTTWLRTVTRNFAFALKREQKRRASREQDAAIREKVPSPAEVLERESLRNRVVEAVLDLDETYRNPILLRYYENLPPREIARRLDLPVETVRTRLKRGLERLRNRLDDEFDGSRKSWCMALAPVAGIKVSDAAAAASAGSASAASTSTVTAGSLTTAAGMAALYTKAKVAGAAVLVIGIVLLAGNLLIPDRNLEPLNASRIHTDLLPRRAAAEIGLSSQEQRGVNQRTAASPGDKDLGVVAPIGKILSGRVRNMVTKEPVERFHFQLIHTRLTASDRAYGMGESIVQEWVEDAEGRFSFPVEQAGSYQITIHSSAHRIFETYCVKVSDRGGPTDLLIELDPGRAITGRVVELDSSKPLEGVLVGPPADTVTGMLFTKPMLYGLPPKGIFTRTDAEGRFTLKGLPPGSQKIIARHPDFIEEKVTTGSDGSLGLIRLRKGIRIFGRAYPERGPITVWVNRRPVLTDEHGAYRSAPVPPGRTAVVVESNTGPETPFGVLKPDQHYLQVYRVLQVNDRDTEVNFGVEEDAVTWQGTFYHRGSAVAGGRIIINNTSRDRSGVKTALQYSVSCDHEGCFTFTHLPMGEYRVSLKLPDPQQVAKGERVSLERPGRIERDIHLDGGRISGVVLDQAFGKPLSTGRVCLTLHGPDEIDVSRTWSSYLDDQGRFFLEGLIPGKYAFGGVAFTIFEVENLETLDLKSPGFQITLEEGQVFEEVIIKSSCVWGFIHLTIQGFEERDHGRIMSSFKMEDGRSFVERQQYWELLSNGTLEKFFRTPPLPSPTVPCTMELSVGREVLTRTFELHSNQVTELHLNRADFRTDHRLLAMSGILHRSGGAPVKDVHLCFSQEELKWKNRAGFVCTTDMEGRFSLEGLLLPGKVLVDALVAEDSHLIFPWNIPEDSSGTVHVPITLPDGSSLNGTLYDGQTGTPCRLDFSPDAVATIELTGKEGWKWTTKLWELDDGRFTVEGVPAGSYRLAIRVRGYLPLGVESLSLAAGQALNLGAIRMEPL